MGDAVHLVWAVNLGVIDFNPWPAWRGDLDHPDELRVDLPDVHRLRRRRDRVSLAFTQVSGGHGPPDARQEGEVTVCLAAARDAAPARARRRARSCHPAGTGSGRQPVCRRARDRRPMRRAAPKPAIVTSRPATMSKR